MIIYALIALTALIVSIVAVSQLGVLKATVAELTRRLADLEKSGIRPAPSPATAVPPPLPPLSSAPVIPPPIPPRRTPAAVSPASMIDWESIVGVKMFAWIGGLALFLGVIFFVKYAFDNNLITPAMRIFAGAIVGLVLVVLAVLPMVRRYRIPAQSLGVTGVLILYADIYAACSFYNLIPLSAASVLMWIVTGVALFLAARTDAPAMVGLGVLGGFLTPVLFRLEYENPVFLFGYTGVLSCGIAAVSALKRWNYFILLAAVGSVVIEFVWADNFFTDTEAQTVRIVFLATQALYLVLAIALARAKLGDTWSLVAAAIPGFASLLFFLQDPKANFDAWGGGLPDVVLSGAGLMILVLAHREFKSNAPAVISFITLGLVGLAEWNWQQEGGLWNGRNVLEAAPMNQALICHIALLLLFAAAPYFGGTKRFWPWLISALTTLLQFWFVYWLLKPDFPAHLRWILPLSFAVPPALGMVYLVKKLDLPLASGDSRLAVQGAAVLALLSLVFPIQFHREWITIGWAIEALGLILLFHWIPNRRLRAVALIVSSAAFVRLALNPAVMYYHPRTGTPIFNWYLYAYGVAAICFILGAIWFGSPHDRTYERYGPSFLYTLGGVVLFLLLNIEIADYFSIGPTLTFSFVGNFARDMTYTIAWALFAFAVLILGMAKKTRALRYAAVALLCLALAKLFLHDLDSLNQLYRIAAFVSVAIIAIIASFAYQRFLSAGSGEH